jgi:type I restriction enzyme S subunit
MNDLNSDKPLPVLPDGWLWTTLGEISKQINSGFASGAHNMTGRGVPHLRPMNVTATGNIDLSNLKYVEIEAGYDFLTVGDVLFNNTNSPELVGKTAYIRQDTNWAYSNHMTRLRFFSNTIVPAFIAYYLHSLFLDGYFKLHCTSHVNQASINPTFLAQQVQLPLPPLAEQHRIVAAIEERLSQIDDGVTMLQRTQRRLKRYRDVILQSAYEGKLVDQNPADEPASILLQRILDERRARWEAEQVARMEAQGRMILDDGWKDDYQEPAPPDIEELPELPEGWVWATLQTIAKIKGGITKSANRITTSATRSIPYLRVANVQRGFLDLGDVRSIEATEEEIQQLCLKRGDVLFNEGGDRDKLGRGWVWNDELPECIHQNHVFRARLYLQDVQPKFISWYGNTVGMNYFFEKGKQTTNLASINMTKLGSLPIPLPPLAEQQRIISETEREFSIVEHIEATIEIALKRIQRLRQVVLKQAFDGKLVPQNPEDEPASRLLQRIREERARREEELQAAREAEAKQPKLRGATVRTKKSSARRPLYDVLAEANRKLRPEELFDQAGFTVEFVEEFYDELRRESPDRITIHRPNDTDVFLEVISNEAR